LVATLRWRGAPSYDGEATTYRVLLDTSPLFPAPQEYDASSDTSATLTDLAAGQTYWWRVQAQEAGEPARVNEPPDGRFAVSSAPVAAPPRAGAGLEFSLPWRAADGSVRIQLSLPDAALVRIRWVDVRGREVTSSPAAWLPAGLHAVEWDGRDARGRSVAAGIYWVVAEAGTAHVSRRVPLLRR
jgi:hypothetical protein